MDARNPGCTVGRTIRKRCVAGGRLRYHGVVRTQAMQDSRVLLLTIFAVAGACAAPTTAQRKLDRDGPPPPINLAFDVRGHAIGLTGAAGGPMCHGEITGAVAITSPKGTVERVTVHVTDVSENICVGCDPLPGDPRSCDNACRREFRSWIELARYAFPWPGDYTISGDELALSCARDRTHIGSMYVTVDASGDTSRIASPSPPLEPTPAPGTATPQSTTVVVDDTATEIRVRFPRVNHSVTGQAEGLAIFADPHQPRRGVSQTRWGELRTFHAGTPYRLVTGDRGPYWISTRADPSAASVPLAIDGRPHIIALVVEDSTDEARRASQNGGVVASAWTQLDDRAQSSGNVRAVTLDVSATLDDAVARWEAFVASQRDEVTRALAIADHDSSGKPFGREKTATENGFAPTWMPDSQHLIVRYAQRSTRWSERKVRERSCPRNRPGPCRDVFVVETRTYHADVALELEYDRSGKLVAERRYPAHPVPQR